MFRVSLIACLVMLACEPSQPHADVVLPQVPPDTIVMSWSLISKSPGRQSVHSVLNASQKLTTTTRSDNGTMMSVSRGVSNEEYARLIKRLRELDCCALESTELQRPDPAEAKPRLELELGDVRCGIELWDREWREGRARECGFAAAQVHRAGFVPDAPVDDASP